MLSLARRFRRRATAPSLTLQFRLFRLDDAFSRVSMRSGVAHRGDYRRGYCRACDAAMPRRADSSRHAPLAGERHAISMTRTAHALCFFAM